MCRTLTVTLLALVAFVQVIESVPAESTHSGEFEQLVVDDGAPANKPIDEYTKFEELYEKVFGANSEPLAPEEAREAIERLYKLGKKHQQASFYDNSLVTGLLRLEKRVKECDFGVSSLDHWQSVDITYFDVMKPALEPYQASLRTRLVECYKGKMDAAVEYFSSKAKADKTGALVHFKELLADIPLELIRKGDFVRTKDEKISKALVSVVKKYAGGECDESNTTKLPSCTQLFLDSVVKFCKEVVQVILVRPGIQSVVFREDTVGILGQEVVDWAKVQRVCNQIVPNSRTAARIVYKTYLDAKDGL